MGLDQNNHRGTNAMGLDSHTLVTWIGKHATMVGHTVLVKLVLINVVIYFITVLDVPLEVLLKIDSIRRAFLSATCEKVFGGKCKVNWEPVCKPKKYGGLGILNIIFFASALRLRWLWNEWVNESKPWLGLGNPCTHHDHELFSVATMATMGNGEKALLDFILAKWTTPPPPQDIASLIFKIAKRRLCTIKKAF
jgi:hypothetical protein